MKIDYKDLNNHKNTKIDFNANKDSLIISDIESILSEVDKNSDNVIEKAKTVAEKTEKTIHNKKDDNSISKEVQSFIEEHNKLKKDKKVLEHFGLEKEFKKVEKKVDSKEVKEVDYKSDFISKIDKTIEIYFNLSKIYTNRAEKTHRAFEVFSEKTTVPAEVKEMMNKMVTDIQILNLTIEYNIQNAIQYRKQIENIKGEDVEKVKKLYLLAMKDLILAKHNFHQEKIIINNMKEVIMEFTINSPFNDSFVAQIACLTKSKMFKETTLRCNIGSKLKIYSK